MEYNSTW